MENSNNTRPSLVSSQDLERFVNAIQNSDIGVDLPRDVVLQIAQASTLLCLEAKEGLTHEGAEGHHAYIILKGAIEVKLAEDPSNPMGTRSLFPGSIIGETGLLEVGRRTAFTYAIEPTELMCMRDMDMHEIFEANPRAGYYFMRNLASVLAKRLRTTNIAIKHSIYIG